MSKEYILPRLVIELVRLAALLQSWLEQRHLLGVSATHRIYHRYGVDIWLVIHTCTVTPETHGESLTTCKQRLLHNYPGIQHNIIMHLYMSYDSP